MVQNSKLAIYEIGALYKAKLIIKQIRVKCLFIMIEKNNRYDKSLAVLKLAYQIDLDLWPCDPKIIRDHLLSKDNTCTQFSCYQAKGSKDFEQTTHGLRPVI